MSNESVSSRESMSSTIKKNERARIQAELKVKQESFVKKERVYKTKIKAQEAEVDALHGQRTSWMKDDATMEHLKT